MPGYHYHIYGEWKRPSTPGPSTPGSGTPRKNSIICHIIR